LSIYINCYDVWVSHNLTEKNLMDRIFICDFLLKRNKNDPFFQTNNHRQWKIDCLHQCRTEKILGKTIWAINRSKGQSASEEDDAVYLMGLEEHRVLRTPSTQPDDNSDKYCSQLDRDTKDSNRWKASGIGKSEGCRLPSGQHQTSRLVAYPAKIGAILAGMFYLTQPYSPNLALSDYHLFRSLR